MRRYSVKSEKGIAMVEALVTALIIAIGLSGVGVLLLRSIQGTQDSAQVSQAMWIVQDYVGRLRANSPAAKTKGYVFNGEMDCDVRPALMCASYNDGGVIHSASNCSSDQMASFDLWSSLCGLDPDTKDSPSDFIAKPVMSSACTLENERFECVQYNITLTWNTKLKQGSPEEAKRVQTNDYSMTVEVN